MTALTPLLAVELPHYPSGGGGVLNLENDSLGTIVSKLLPHIFVLGGLLMLVMFLYGGLQLLISAGDPEGIREGKAKVTWALVGFLLIFSSYFIGQIIETVFGIKIF